MSKENGSGGVTIGNVSGGIHGSIIAGQDVTVNTPIRGQDTKTGSATQEKHLIKILFLAANPSDTTRLRVDEENRAIDQALRQTEFRDQFDIRQHWAVRVSDLQGLLLRHQPHIVHFSGHGSESCEIILEDNAGNSHPVSARVLSHLFAVLKDNIRCVVLNACYSEAQARAIAEHIDCVVGMSAAIGDKASISFATAFYQALGYGRDVKTAFELGRLQIGMENLDEASTPKLLALRQAVDDSLLSARSSQVQSEPNLVHQLWPLLDPDLQDVLSLAYNQAQREGKHRISTRIFFAAINRLKPEPLPALMKQIPAHALPTSISQQIPLKRLTWADTPSLSSCVEDSFRHLAPKSTPQNRLSTADIFVDIVQYGTGESIQRLRTYGVTRDVITKVVNQLGWEVIRR